MALAREREVRKDGVTERLQALKKLLADEQAGTQDEIRAALEDQNFEVNQSTISRDLKRVGAVKLIDSSGQTVYRLNENAIQRAPLGLTDLVTGVFNNAVMIVISTTPGSASLVARFVDQFHGDSVLGTIAGDDTVFVAPVTVKGMDKLCKKIEKSLMGN